jgi:hypothetical protein
MATGGLVPGEPFQLGETRFDAYLSSLAVDAQTAGSVR